MVGPLSLGISSMVTSAPEGMAVMASVCGRAEGVPVSKTGLVAGGER